MARPDEFHQMIKTYGAEQVIQTLSPYITQERSLRIDRVLDARLSSLQVAVESPYDIHNALAIVRTAEALGVTKVHMMAPEKIQKKGKHTARGSKVWSQVFRYDTTAEYIDQIRKEGVKIAGACVRASHTLSELPLKENLCLLFGNEHRGLSQEASAACDYTFSIPMFGMVESLNLSVAAAISLYSYSERRRKFLGKDGDLSEEERLVEKAWGFVQTFELNKAKLLLESTRR